MAEHLQHAPQVGAMGEQVTGEGMPQDVRRDGRRVDADLDGELLQLADEDVLVIATSGGKPPHELGFAIPHNARLVPFIPFVVLMPYVDCYITNGGYGGVTVALANGVPIISAGTTEDKPEVGNRIEYSGVGCNLRTHRPSAEQVRTAFRRVMGDPSNRQRAQVLQAELAQHDAPREAADLLERLAQTRQPVL